ncbi:RNA polymerase, sigma 28 subunit, FliA/WhiG [Spirochaeta thermophila DSM 6578]|uniref:RNA polymerase, sigma 28 subunit, FliA/WhiG n=1 Tax=Winmispira thermophila (strain ATCC 700085 / DSM 6578 / Z-1203) TaxID=869211 RepID=G0GCE8_WINT7|nr:RNA polymerase sigma factor WhiG [Spirochaeta thermophila]AEJ61233.1 RNA polymerase, sigma 28 subunit, FliA/WhiG [Spirochaeta thermophila DSM 6578]
MDERSLAQRTEDELWKEYQKTRDPQIREYFIKQYAPLVKYVAGKIAVGLPSSVEFDDLIGFGTFGLLDAIEKFDPEKHVKFKTYAVTRIRGAIYDELRAMDWVPRSVRQKSKEIEDALHRLESSLGRAATDEELAREMNMSSRELQKTLQKISSTSILSLQELWYTGDENDRVAIADMLEAPQAYDPAARVEREEIKRVVAEAIKELPEKEKKVLVLYYYEDLTLKEIGAILNVTESRVSQLHTKAISRLRVKLRNIRKGIF